MKVLKVKKLKKRHYPQKIVSGKCLRCQGYMVQEWESEVIIQRCVLCGHREEIEAAKNADSILSW